MPSPPDDGTRTPRIPAAARRLRGVVVMLLAVSAALTLAWVPWLRGPVAAGRWPRAVLAVPPILLGAFIAVYAVYRFTLVRAGRYPAGKALAQVGLMLLVLGVVAGVALDPGPLARRPGRLERALRSGDPDVRAIAAELVRFRPPSSARPLVPRLIELLDDPDPDVRREAHASLVAVTGEDLGEDEGAVARWRARWDATR